MPQTRISKISFLTQSRPSKPLERDYNSDLFQLHLIRLTQTLPHPATAEGRVHRRRQTLPQMNRPPTNLPPMLYQLLLLNQQERAQGTQAMCSMSWHNLLQIQPERKDLATKGTEPRKLLLKDLLGLCRAIFLGFVTLY